MSMGPHTVTFVTITEGAPGRVGPTEVKTQTDVTGCFMQPLSASEVITETDVQTELWRCLAPPVDAVTAANPNGELIFNGGTYEITGVKPFYDFAGLDHVTIDCELQRG